MVKINTSVAARSGVESRFRIRANGDYLGNISVQSTDLGYYTSTYAYDASQTFSYAPQSGNLTVTLKYEQPDSRLRRAG